MKTFTTSIFVPETAKANTKLIDIMEWNQRLSKPVPLFSDIMHGAMDDLVEREEFSIFVNGQHHRHEIKMLVTSTASGKARIIFAQPEKEEVKRFAEWRIKTSNLISLNRGSHYQLRNFGIQDLRRLICHARSNHEAQLVTYR